MKQKLIFGIVVLIALVFSNSAMAIGIGISPSEINITNAMRGSEYERALTIINPGVDSTRFSLNMEGDSKEWIYFYYIDKPSVKINEILINSSDKAVVVVKINIPEDASSSTYKSNIIVETVPEKIDDMNTGVSAKLMASTALTIGVTGEQIIDGIARTITIDDTEPGYPLRINAIFQNTGNVVVKPKIMANLFKDAKMIGNLTYENTKVKPTLSETIIADWNTTSENIPGDYIANINVSLNGKELRSEILSFKILPSGTLTRQGNLTSIIIEGEPSINIVSKVHVNFENTGRIDTLAKFNGELYKDGNLIDTLDSEELTVQYGKEIELVSYVKPISAGEYIIKGSVNYGGKKTPVKEVSFKITDPKSTPGFEVIITALSVLVLMLLIRKTNYN